MCLSMCMSLSEKNGRVGGGGRKVGHMYPMSVCRSVLMWCGSVSVHVCVCVGGGTWAGVVIAYGLVMGVGGGGGAGGGGGDCLVRSVVEEWKYLYL